MGPQSHPLLYFLVRMKPSSTNVFPQVSKNVEVTRGKIWDVERMLKCFPVKSLKLIPHQIGNIIQKDDSIQQHSRAFWLYVASQHPQPPRNEPHLSALLCLPPFPMLDEHTLHYAHLQSNKETNVWSCAFPLCMSPALQMAVSIRNNCCQFLRGICFMAGIRVTFSGLVGWVPAFIQPSHVQKDGLSSLVMKLDLLGEYM